MAEETEIPPTTPDEAAGTQDAVIGDNIEALPNLVVIPATGIRYLTPCFTEWTEEELEYQPGYKCKIYQPANDTITKRPVIILHTGGGTISIDSLHGLAVELVKLGYVVVPAQYKLTVGDGFTEDEQIQGALNDYILIDVLRKASVRYGIKKKKFFIIGTSAGGINASNTGITGNDTDNPIYKGKAPNIKGCILHTASLSAAALGLYYDLIQTGGVPNQFFNGGKDMLIPSKQAEATCSKELAFGIPSFIKVYPNSDHTLGEHQDIYYNPSYGIIPTFYNKLNTKQPKP